MAVVLLCAGILGPTQAQTTQDLPTSIPSLSGYDSETRLSMQIACSSDNAKGPAAYGACLNRQIASLQGSPGIPNLSGYDSETRLSMQIACSSDNAKGPAAYGACLNRQIASLQGSPSIPNPTGGGTAVHAANGSGTDVAPQVKDGWLQVSEDMSFRVDSMKISMLMQTKMDDGQVHYNIVAVPYTVCSQGYGKIRFYDLKHAFVYGADAALNGNSRGSFVATMLCAVRSEAIKPK